MYSLDLTELKIQIRSIIIDSLRWFESLNELFQIIIVFIICYIFLTGLLQVLKKMILFAPTMLFTLLFLIALFYVTYMYIINK